MMYVYLQVLKERGRAGNVERRGKSVSRGAFARRRRGEKRGLRAFARRRDEDQSAAA